ncbi:MAG TPA: right-handed parallel beta-helix repeat-containing protein [Planctomycetota bacterium]|nr:right-handed parallel beta-helix repeat-containing protein [Planctomycetota bacterium]
MPTLRLIAAAALALAAGDLAAAVHRIGPGDDLGRIRTLHAGDVVEIASGTYNQAARWSCAGTPDAPVVIRGVGPTRPLIDATGVLVDGAIRRPRACLQIDGVDVVVERLEFANARNSQNGCGFRSSAPRDALAATVVLRDCVIHDCDMGIQSDGGQHLVVEGCDIFRCGTPDFAGASHNIYAGNRRLTVRGSWIHDSTVGYNIKTRCHYVELLYNLISGSAEGEVDLVDSDWTRLPDANALMLGNVVVSTQRLPTANKQRFVVFGDEGEAHPGSLFVYHNTFIAGTPDIDFLSCRHPESGIIAANNVFWGSGTVGTSCDGPFAGAANWIEGGGRLPPGFAVGGVDPRFVAPATGDFRLAASSPCRDLGRAPLPYRDGDGNECIAVAEWMYVAVGDLAPRGVDARCDLGAYEVGGKVGGANRRARRAAAKPKAKAKADPEADAQVPAGDAPAPAVDPPPAPR